MMMENLWEQRWRMSLIYRDKMERETIFRTKGMMELWHNTSANGGGEEEEEEEKNSPRTNST